MVPENVKKSPLGWSTQHQVRQYTYITILAKLINLGLVQHLRTNAPLIHDYYEQLKAKNSDFLTEEELVYARGEKIFSIEQLKEFRLAASVNSIEAAFARQVETKVVSVTLQSYSSAYYNASSKEPWNQKMFERKIAEWVAAEDIPFSAIEKPYFKSLLNFLYRASGLQIPSADTIQRRTLKMGDESISDLKHTINVSSLSRKS